MHTRRNILKLTVPEMKLYSKSDQHTLCKNTNLTYCPCIQCVLLAWDCCFSKHHLSEARRSSPNHRLSRRGQCEYCTSHHAVYKFLLDVRGPLGIVGRSRGMYCTSISSESCHVARYFIQYKELYIYCLFGSP